MRVCLPIWRRGCGIRSRLSLAPAAFCYSFRTLCERLLDTRMADGVTRPGFFPQLEHRLGARSFDFETPNLRMSTLLASDLHLGNAFSDAWASLRERDLFISGRRSTAWWMSSSHLACSAIRPRHGKQPGTDRRGPPPQSEHRRQSISSPRSLRFPCVSRLPRCLVPVLCRYIPVQHTGTACRPYKPPPCGTRLGV